jgi:ABC-type Zn2+ transport system substrate-binding protein/surface adhesin
LESASRGHRLRGLEMAIAMEVVGQVEPHVLWFLQDEDHIVRTLAADALVASDSDAAREALQAALHDPHFAVRAAAENTLQQLAALHDTSFAVPHDVPLSAVGESQGPPDDALCALPAAGSYGEVRR